jgi:large subunit ribosomal protein L24
MKFKIKRNDTVKVIVGKEKGKTGKVRKVLRDQNKVIVEGVNLVTKHVKATQDGPGRKFKQAAPLHVSNIALWDEEGSKIIKVGFIQQTDKDGNRQVIRVDKSTNEPIDK